MNSASPSLICLCFALLVQTDMVPCDAADVDQTSCTNGGTECSAIANSVCDIAALKCKCAAYATMAGAACTATACTSADTPCTAKDTNSVCVGTTACGCKTGFSLGVDGKCYQSVTSTVCTASGTECSSITNALCDTTFLKCKCAWISAIIANTCTGKACTASTTCTALDSNSECSGSSATGKCQCKSGYKIGSDGKCAASAASAAMISMSMALVCFMATLV